MHFLSGRYSTWRAPFFSQIYLPPFLSYILMSIRTSGCFCPIFGFTPKFNYQYFDLSFRVQRLRDWLGDSTLETRYLQVFAYIVLWLLEPYNNWFLKISEIRPSILNYKSATKSSKSLPCRYIILELRDKLEVYPKYMFANKTSA